MRRLLALILAALAAFLAAPQTSAVAAPVTSTYVYTYYGHRHPAPSATSISERGPPAGFGRATTYDALDAPSGGVSARLKPSVTIAYDRLAPVVQVAQATATTQGLAEAIDAGLAVLEPAGVAANAAPRLLSPSSLADEVANATGGVLKTNKGGFTINVPNGARGITVRVMERGGSRTNYYRVSVPGKETYTITGETSTDAALTHMDIGESSLDDILSIIARIQGAG